MTNATARRLFRIALGLALAASAGTAAAQNMAVAPSASTPPLANAVTQNVASSIFLDVTNQRTGTTMNEVAFFVPYAATGGAGPAGWALQALYPYNGGMYVAFQVTTCGQGGLGNGQTGKFRIDMTPTSASAGPIAADVSDNVDVYVFADPCGGNPNWTSVSTSYRRKALSMTGSAVPAVGPAPLATTVTWTVKNQSTASQSNIALTGTPKITVTPSAGVTFTCSPATLPALAAGASNTFSCNVTLPTSGTSYTIAAAAGNATATAAGATAGPILVASATAAFAFDKLFARSGDLVRATLTVTNRTASAIDVTPPTYAQLSLTPTLTRASGTTDPAAANGVAAGGSASFVYAFTVSGLVEAAYSATGTAGTTVGNTNPATTPPGSISAWGVGWTPLAIVKSRKTSPYGFSVTVANGAQDAITRVDVVNPNAGWTGLVHGTVTNSGGSNLAYSSGDNTGTLTYGSGSVPLNGSATLAFSFTGIPTESVTTPYTFRVVVTNTWDATRTYTFTVQNTVPIPDVANLGILSTSAGQTLYWTNTSATNEPHDGVVVFRAAAPTAPSFPADGTDYTGSPSAIYCAKYGSSASSLADPVTGAYYYRVCNHDANFIYSNCSTGFWSNAGWLDSASAPAGGWTYTTGYQVLLYPGIVPGGRVGFASNAPALNVLTAATGARPFDPVSLAAVPAMGTPVVTLRSGRQVMFAADQGGVVTALDVTTGATYWQVTKSGESFVSGVSGALWLYAGSAFQGKYANDVLFLGSTTGKLLALDATTGAPLWTVTAGTEIRALPLYDYAKNWLYVPTNGGGILAYDLLNSTLGTPPVAATGWNNPGGAYTLGCTRADVATLMTCVDKTGGIKVLNRSTGATVATGAFTGGGTPSTVWKVPSGLVVGSANAVQTFTLSGASFTSRGAYQPAGTTLSQAQVFVAEGFIYVGGSDLKLHKLRLADAIEVLPAATVTSRQAGTFLGPAAYDMSSNRFVFGASDGHVWAVPYF
jgi:hypothetical protein